MLKFKHQTEKLDKILLFLCLGLSLFGALMIFNASSVSAVETFQDKYYFFKNQITYVLTGWVIIFFVSKMNYHFWKKIAFSSFIFGLICLILVLFPGLGMKIMGSRRRLDLGLLSFQPAELMKIILIIYLTTFFEKKTRFWPFLVIIGVISFLLILEPDLGTAIILITSALIIYFLSGGKILEFIILGSLGLAGGLGFILTSAYRMARLKVFLNPDFDPLGASYHLHQILLALGSGGFWGRGIGQSRQKFLFLPETATDSIFAVIGEEMGFLGALVILIAFFWLFLKGLRIAQQAPDRFGQVLAGGIVSLIFLQTFLNLASIVSLVPLTGVPLPFLSYGGSFTLVLFVCIGILLNISKYCVNHR